MKTLIPKIKVEDMLKQCKHLEKRGMLNIYICTNCESQFMFVYFDSGVTPVTMKCPKCGGFTAESCICKVRQPDSIWFRPNSLDDIKQIVKDAYEHDKKYYKQLEEKSGVSEHQIKKQILDNYVKHYNQGGLFSISREQID